MCSVAYCGQVCQRKIYMSHYKGTVLLGITETQQRDEHYRSCDQAHLLSVMETTIGVLRERLRLYENQRQDATSAR